MKRIAKQDPWNYILENFERLAAYYARRFAAIAGDRDLVHDFKTDILIEMHTAYQKYRLANGVSMIELGKIMKTIPVYFYRNTVMRKAYSADFAPIEDVVIAEPETAASLYDRFYEQYLDQYCSATRVPDDFAILFEVLYPSESFKEYAMSAGSLSTKTLRDYFLTKKQWSIDRFRFAFGVLAQEGMAA